MTRSGDDLIQPFPGLFSPPGLISEGSGGGLQSFSDPFGGGFPVEGEVGGGRVIPFPPTPTTTITFPDASSENETELTSATVLSSQTPNVTTIQAAASEELKSTSSITASENRIGYFTAREQTILISTLVPAVIVIVILSVLLVYFIYKRQRRSRVGMQNQHLPIKEDGRPSSGLPRSHSGRGAEIGVNGSSNGASRAWEVNEVPDQR